MADALSKYEWMRTWMTPPSWVEVSAGALFLGRFADPMYFLREPIAWSPDPPDEGKYPSIKVPAGFVTDLASIPRAFWSLLRPDGRYTYPAIIHDYSYWTQTIPRGTADMIFKLGMREFDVGAVTIEAIYEGVVMGGEAAWRENARLKQEGEKRLLKKYPDDPRVTWEQWKADPSVFA